MLAAVVALTVALSAASSALAVQHHPKGIFAVFADCPLSDPAVEVCLTMRITSGELILGRKTVPIAKTITVRGGYFENQATGEDTFVGAEDGATLSKTVLSVPGGLLGLAGSTSATEATATTELAGPANAIGLSVEHLLSQHGVALRLSVKAKLSNRLLGNSCYVGSEDDPLVLDLVTGTTSPPAPNRPIAGTWGQLEGKEEAGSEQIILLNGISFVDNAFPVPAVSGCGGLYSPLASSALGVPSPAGHNTAILTGIVEVAGTASVKASE